MRPRPGCVSSVALAYARLAAARDTVRRVVVLGPVHRVALRGSALPGVARFATPLAVGDATATEVAEVLERVWGGPETLIVVGSDLSHYLPYAAASSMHPLPFESQADAVAKWEESDVPAPSARWPLPGLRPASGRSLGRASRPLRASAHTDCDRRLNAAAYCRRLGLRQGVVRPDGDLSCRKSVTRAN